MRDIAFVVYPGYSVMALAVVTAFEVANMLADDPPYELHFVSETGSKVKTSSVMMLETEAFTDMPFDTLVVGGATTPVPSTPGLIAFMRDAPKRHRRIAAVCTGSFVLAEAGLLNGRHATTHWGYARDLYQQPGFGDTTDFGQIKRHYYQTQDWINPSGIVPKGPYVNWLSPHDRDRFSPPA